MRGSSWIMVSIVSVLMTAAFAGCMDSGAVEGSFKDADTRYTNSFTGGHDRSHNFNVPAGSDDLRIALHYDVSGGFTVQLYGPTGMKDQLSEGGVAEQKDDSWYSSSSPTPGEWRIHVSGGGSGAYTLGVYMD